ncbi:MAG: DNA internalization-related competence protein ComEC/Rec2 [Thiotrichales bacterium]|nr:DNA internalization-related competence protein ComEC/Rec2 [Thiotrichales bacterium]
MSWGFWQSFFSFQPLGEALNTHALLTAKVLQVEGTPSPASLSAGSVAPSRIKLHLSVQSMQPFRWEKSSESAPLLRWQPEQTFAWYLPIVQISLTPQQISARLPQVGETWRFAAKIKSPHSSQNFFASDYETYLFSQGVAAKGYLPLYSPTQQQALYAALTPSLQTDYSISSGRQWVGQRLQPASSLDWRLWRASFIKRLQDSVGAAPFWRIYQALLFGERDLLSADDWLLLQHTGTLHLMAISGLHMAIVAGLGALMFKGFWWLGLYRLRAITLPHLMAFGALLLASFYLLMSGGSIPTQRAWIMVVSALVFIVLWRRFQPWTALAIAALAVLFWDSRAVLSPGFWLSFAAVALIFITLPSLKNRPAWQSLLALQFLLTFGLAPLMIGFFQQLPLMGLVANLIAVPVVSLVALPLLFISALLSLILPSLSAPFWWFNEQLWQLLWWILQALDAMQGRLGARLVFSEQSMIWVLALLGAAFALWRLWVEFWNRRQPITSVTPLLPVSAVSHSKSSWSRFASLWLGIALLTIGVAGYTYQSAPRLQAGQFLLWVFDVGQGLAVAVQTEHHLLLYDTGPRWGASSAVDFSVLPWWRAQGSPEVEMMVVSHSDNDHAGGVPRLMTQMTVKKVLSSQLSALNLPSEQLSQPCQQGQTWVWDQVRFAMLAPSTSELADTRLSDNDRSCVLKISTGQGQQARSVLLPGDLTAEGEARLLRTQGAALQKITLLMAGHHGSHHSSSLAWLRTLNPDWLVFSAGYQNGFDFPNDALLTRLQTLPSAPNLLNTACSGAQRWFFAPGQVTLQEEARKSSEKWYYQRCLQQIK